MKKCCVCQELKSFDSFPRRKTSKDGRDYRCKACASQYYHDNFETISKQKRVYAQSHRESLLNQKRAYMASHREEKSKYDLQYRKDNKERIALYKKNWERLNKNDLHIKVTRNLRRRIAHVLKGETKSASTLELLGCSFEEFIHRLESQFIPGMTWENYGRNGWHIDHITPCYKFDLSNPEEQRKCFHYTNQRPLWAKDNLTRRRN